MRGRLPVPEKKQEARMKMKEQGKESKQGSTNRRNALFLAVYTPPRKLKSIGTSGF